MNKRIDVRRTLVSLGMVATLPGICLFVVGCPFAPPTDLCADVTCEAGFTCDAATGQCVAEEPVDLCADVNCDEGSTCDPDTGTCVEVDPCEDITCADGTTCVDGICVDDQPADLCADVTCDAGETCVDGTCVADQPAGGDAVAGEAFYMDNNCAACHGADATGVVGPNIVGRDAATVLNVLTVDGEHGIGPNLPETTPQDADDIAAYLGSL